jgi:magnesium transporter
MDRTILERLVLPEVRELLESRDLSTLSAAFERWDAVDIAAVVADLGADERTWVFRALAAARASDVFEYLDLDDQEQLVESLPSGELAKVLNGMDPDDRTALLANLPRDRTQRLLSLLTPNERHIAETLLAYPDESVGRLMTPDYIAVKEHWTVSYILEYVRAYGSDRETLNAVYVTDDRGTLVDDLRMREVLLAPLNATVRDLMDGKIVSLRVDDDQQHAVEVFRRYDRTALPVVNDSGKLVGIVTVDDVLDVAELKATRELQRFGGVEALDVAYSATPLLLMVRKRASWLVVLFLGELLTATAMGYFEDQLDRAVVLALFVPLIISSGGNSGSQAATLLVRALAVGEVQLREWRRIFARELLSGLLLGLILGTIGFLRIAAWSAFSDIYGPHWFLVALTVAFTLVGVVLWGALTGSMLPFVLKRLGFDPASSSAPFVATLVDVTGLIIYFTIATLILQGTVL